MRGVRNSFGLELPGDYVDDMVAEYVVVDVVAELGWETEEWRTEAGGGLSSFGTEDLSGTTWGWRRFKMTHMRLCSMLLAFVVASNQSLLRVFGTLMKCRKSQMSMWYLVRGALHYKESLCTQRA